MGNGSERSAARVGAALRGFLWRLAWVVTGAVLVLAILRSTVGDVYRVGSGSMRPTIFGGEDARTGEVLDERVLVRFGRAEGLGRFDLVVVRRGPETPIVKRVGGLPGESVGIVGGDLIVGDKRLPLETPRPAPIPVFDDALHDVRDYFVMRADDGDPWSPDGASWRLDASGVAAGSDAGMMLFAKDLRDDYIDQHGRRVIGLREANDARVEFEVAPRGASEAGGRLRLRLVEAGDTFEALLEWDGADRALVTIERFNSASLQDPENPGGRIPLVEETAVNLRKGEWTTLAFENVDNHLILDVGDTRLTASYAANAPHAGPTAAGATSLGPRVALGGEGVIADFRRIRISRDLYYVAMGSHGVDRPRVLGPDELFVLGDNSSASRDSRMFGPVSTADVIGRPLRVVWPFDRARALQEPVPR